jgi:hypothetical protein
MEVKGNRHSEACWVFVFGLSSAKQSQRARSVPTWINVRNRCYILDTVGVNRYTHSSIQLMVGGNGSRPHIKRAPS